MLMLPGVEAERRVRLAGSDVLEDLERTRREQRGFDRGLERLPGIEEHDDATEFGG